ncbi:MAG: hypothetical protein ACE5OZ_23140 [Candidatus Heimdallarchaeota archaeon]
MSQLNSNARTLQCVRCEYVWESRLERLPRKCPRCQSWLDEHPPEIVQEQDEAQSTPSSDG